MKIYIKNNIREQRNLFILFVPEHFKNASAYLVIVKRYSIKRKINAHNVIVNLRPHIIRKYDKYSYLLYSNRLDESWRIINNIKLPDIDKLINRLKNEVFSNSNLSTDSSNAIQELVGYLDYEFNV